MKHNNPKLTEEMVRIFKLKGESAAEYVEDSITPVVSVQPRMEAPITTAPTTTDATRDTLIHALQLQYSKTAADTGTSLSITGVVNGATVTLLRLRGTTLVQENAHTSISLPRPIRVDRNSVITVSATGTFAASTFSVYYTLED